MPTSMLGGEKAEELQHQGCNNFETFLSDMKNDLLCGTV